MPFDFGSFDFDFAGSLDFDVSDFTSVASVTSDLGAEFITGSNLTDAFSVASFDIDYADIASAGGWSQVGDFAGNPDWFDAFYGGDIIDGAAAATTPGYGDIISGSVGGGQDVFGPLLTPGGELEVGVRAATGLAEPTLSFGDQLRSIATQVQQDFTGFIKGAQEAQKAFNKIAPLVNVVTAALKIPNPLGQVGQVLNTATAVAGVGAGVAGGVAAVTGNVRTVNGANAVTSGTVLVPGQQLPGGGQIVTSAGVPADAPFRELTDAETRALITRNVDPRLINTFVPVGTGNQSYDAALITQTELLPEAQRLNAERTEIQIFNAAAAERVFNLESQLSNPDLTEQERDELLTELIVAQTERAELEQAENDIISRQSEVAEQLANADSVIATTNASVTTQARSVPVQPGTQYQTVFNPQNQTWSIRDITNGLTLAANLTQNQTLATAANLGIQLNNLALNTSTTADVFAGLSDEEILARRNPNNLSDEEVIARQNSITAGLRDAARNQQAIRELRNTKAQSSDWRVRLKLAPNSTYLYNDTSTGPNGILFPLKQTDGVIFPYTPAIDTAYKANYDTYDLVHSNYRGYFYKNSYVDLINVRATFTAQDTNEANYLLAVIHFFRSCTKMFYGKDTQRGSPPPLVYLSGYGDFQFNEHPCLVSQFNYQLPPDVDYIRAQNWLSNNTNLQLARLRNPVANNPLVYSVNRLLNSRLLPGALDPRPATTSNLNDGSPTYVPTKMEISITLLPVQSRSNISQNFSLQGFANGNLLKGGYW